MIFRLFPRLWFLFCLLSVIVFFRNLHCLPILMRQAQYVTIKTKSGGVLGLCVHLKSLSVSGSSMVLKYRYPVMLMYKAQKLKNTTVLQI